MPIFYPCGAAPRGGGGAPPTTLILLRNQRKPPSSRRPHARDTVREGRVALVGVFHALAGQGLEGGLPRTGRPAGRRSEDSGHGTSSLEAETGKRLRCRELSSRRE